MALDFSQRSSEEEIMDNFNMSGALLRDSIDKIAGINKWLGGNTISLQAIKKLLRNTDNPVTIVDVGCAGGHMCRAIATWARARNKTITIIGVDANRDAIDYAEETSGGFPEISYICADVFAKGFQFPEMDIALCTLTLHHFSNDEIFCLLPRLHKKARIGVVINDLHRSRMAYVLYQLICAVFRLNKMLRYDGSVSILSGFKRKELKRFSEQLNFKNHTIRWRWAFRYEWIIPSV